jgi:hypothetical protein
VGKENPRDRQIWKTCTGFKNPLELHKNMEIVIYENFEFIKTIHRGNTWLSDDVSAPVKPKGKNLVFTSWEIVKSETIYTVDRKRGT